MLRTGRARFPGISAQASPRGSRARRSAGRLLAVVCPPVAARVEETLFRLVVRWVLPGVDDRLFGDRLAGGPQPLLPFVGLCGWWSACRRSPPQTGQRPRCLLSSRRTVRLIGGGTALRRRWAQ